MIIIEQALLTQEDIERIITTQVDAVSSVSFYERTRTAAHAKHPVYTAVIMNTRDARGRIKQRRLGVLDRLARMSEADLIRLAKSKYTKEAL